MILKKTTQTGIILGEFSCNQQGWEVATELEMQNFFLNQAKAKKIAEIKEKRDNENIKPLIRQGNLVNPTTMEILPETIQFYFVATKHPTNQASDAGTLLDQAQKRGLIPYFTKNVATNEKAVIALTAELSINIENHLLNRNATNYYHYGQLEAQINNATTIEQVEAITW